MNQDKNEAAQEFMEEIVDDLGYAPKGGKNQGSGSSVHQTRVSKYLIPGGMGIVLVIAAILFFLMGRNGNHTEELASIQSALTRLEERMAGLTRLEERMSRLEGLKGLRGLEDRIIRLEKEQKSLQQDVRQIASRDVTPSPKGPAPEVKQTAGRDMTSTPKKADAEVKQRYHTVRPGENLYTIARKYGISADTLCSLNKITPKKPIQPGQKLLVGK